MLALTRDDLEVEHAADELVGARLQGVDAGEPRAQTVAHVRRLADVDHARIRAAHDVHAGAARRGFEPGLEQRGIIEEAFRAPGGEHPGHCIAAQE